MSPTPVEPPPSDGVGSKVRPTPLFSPGVKHKMFYRAVQDDETRAQTYLSKGATLLHDELKTAPKNPEGFVFNTMPTGYELFEHNNDGRKDVYLYGHPSGKRFRSVLEFVPHLVWLATGRTSNCECFACGTNKKRKPAVTHRKVNTKSGKTTPKKLRRNATIVIDDDSSTDILPNTVHRKRTKLDDTAFAASLPSKLSDPIRIDSESPELIASTSPSFSPGSKIREIPRDSPQNAYDTIKARTTNIQSGTTSSEELRPPTSWDGVLQYRGSPIQVTATVLEVTKDNRVVYPNNSHSEEQPGACTLFAAFPLKMNLQYQIPAAKLRWMIAAAQEYITETRKVSSLSWAYRIIVMPTGQPVERKKFDELNSALNESYGASVFVKQDGIQVLLTPAGNCLTGYAMLEEAFPNWSEGSTLPLV